MHKCKIYAKGSNCASHENLKQTESWKSVSVYRTIRAGSQRGRSRAEVQGKVMGRFEGGQQQQSGRAGERKSGTVGQCVVGVMRCVRMQDTRFKMLRQLHGYSTSNNIREKEKGREMKRKRGREGGRKRQQHVVSFNRKRDTCPMRSRKTSSKCSAQVRLSQFIDSQGRLNSYRYWIQR